MNGIHPRLNKVMESVDKWCKANHIAYDLACDESNIQGIKIFQKDRRLVHKLLEHISGSLKENNVHLEYEKVRGGTIMIFSLDAISEHDIRRMIEAIGEEVEPITFLDKLTDATMKRISPTKKDSQRHGFLESAKRLLECDENCDELDHDKKKKRELQKSVDNRVSQSTTNSRIPALGASKGVELKFEAKVASALGSRHKSTTNRFDASIREALDGIATPNGEQPGDLFSKFARALRVLGDHMGVGPLQDLLTQRGIKWKKSADEQSVILYVINAQTKAPQPIARISAETLENPSDFENQLTTMLDFAKGDAPGAFKQKQQELQDQQKTVRDIARAVSPQDKENPVVQQMGSTDVAPQQSEGMLDTEKAAAATAALPKVGV